MKELRILEVPARQGQPVALLSTGGGLSAWLAFLALRPIPRAVGARDRLGQPRHSRSCLRRYGCGRSGWRQRAVEADRVHVDTVRLGRLSDLIVVERHAALANKHQDLISPPPTGARHTSIMCLTSLMRRSGRVWKPPDLGAVNDRGSTSWTSHNPRQKSNIGKLSRYAEDKSLLYTSRRRTPDHLLSCRCGSQSPRTRRSPLATSSMMDVGSWLAGVSRSVLSRVTRAVTLTTESLGRPEMAAGRNSPSGPVSDVPEPIRESGRRRRTAPERSAAPPNALVTAMAPIRLTQVSHTKPRVEAKCRAAPHSQTVHAHAGQLEPSSFGGKSERTQGADRWSPQHT